MATDIEIYVRDLDEGRLLHWLNATCGSARETWRMWGQVGFETDRGPVIVTLCIEEDPFVGIAFPWGRALWPTDAACARQAARDLGRAVRCVPGPDFPQVHPCSDIFLEVHGSSERLFEWSEEVVLIDRLAADVPELQRMYEAHLRDNVGELLPHVFFGDLTRFVVSGFAEQPERRADAEKILVLLEEAMGSPIEDVQNLVSVSFCENLLGEKPLEAIRAAMGPRLRAELANYEGS